MRHSIRTKIILLGSITSFLLIGIALLISCFVYQNRAYLQLDKNVDKSVHEIKYNIGEDAVKFLEESISRIGETVETRPDDPVMNTYEEKLKYYTEKYDFIYPSSGGLGLSYQKAEYRNQYMDISSDLKAAVVSSGGKAAYIGFISPDAERMYYLADSNFVFDTKYDASLPLSDYKFYGSYRVLPESFYESTDVNDSEGFLCWTSVVDGYKHRVAEVTFGNGVYETDEFGDTYEHGITIYILIRYDTKEIDGLVTNYLITEIISFSGVLLLLIILFGLASHFLIAKNVTKLNSSTLAFTKSMSENQEIQIIDPKITTKDELGTLSKSFVSLETTLIDYINQVERDTIEKERMNAELNVASKIQLEALPSSNLNDENVLIKASIKSAKEIGGDFYDYFYVDDNHLAIIISDVTGKGVPAALFMMKSKELIKSRLLNKEELTKVCYDVNNALLVNNTQGLFITAFIGVLDVKTRVLKFVNAGHERPFIISKNKVRQLDVHSNFILGGIENFEYQADEITLDADDKLFLHTDGLNESINSNNEEFGYDRILKVLDDNKKLQMGDNLIKMSESLRSFVGDVEAFDDITMIIVVLKSSKLHFEFNKPTYEIIDEVNNKFNDYYSYLDEKTISEVNIIFDELLNNYVSYEKNDDLYIKIDIDIKNDMLVFRFENNGMEFNPLEKDDNHIEKYDENLPIGGLGITIIKNLSTDISYERKNDKNILKIKKKI